MFREKKKTFFEIWPMTVIMPDTLLVENKVTQLVPKVPK